MHDKRVLVSVVVSVVVLMICGDGFAHARDAVPTGGDADGMHLVLGLVASYLCFLWYCADSDERGFRRPRWLGAAMILFAPAAVPYYLVRTRAGRARMHALLGYAGCVGLCVLGAAGPALLRSSSGLPA